MKAGKVTKDVVLKAIREERLRVTGEFIETKGPWAKSQWRERTWAPVHPPGRPERPYYRISFTSSAGSFRCLVHRLLWFADGREIPEGTELNHMDGNKKNCALDNLEVVTQAQNIQHAFATGLKVGNRGAKAASRRRFTDDQVREVRRSCAEGVVSQTDIAGELGISPSQISRMITRRTYAWVE